MHYNYARLRLKSSLHPSLKFSISRDFVNCISFTNYYHLHIIKIQWPHTLTRTYYKYYTWINPLLGHAAWHCHVSCITITFSQRFHGKDLSPISQANRYTPVIIEFSCCVSQKTDVLSFKLYLEFLMS